ncbi:ABC transporter permease [Nocardioides euryhalodurans]|uniref:ABC transporter permease n=1 Tax=Nocardioides euryhalodurans TaxID=2518370 RepID=A0A4P7GL18_9ACTN|nr:FtsX-like permease family protein [Nocardioides euryhalodurans]QBR92776.1 ABC transporter permease [Nocardioides euryhalodurans]
MFRLTLRALLARKVRLIMSTLAIVLGIGFLTGVLVFSNGLGSTFDGIIKGSTPDALVRPAGTGSFEAVGSGNSTRLTPEDVEALAGLPEVERADGNVDGLGMYLLDTEGKLVGGQGAPTIAFNYNDTPNLLDEPSLELVSGDWPEGPTDVVLDTGAAENAGYEVGDEVTVIAPAGDSIENVRKTLTMTGTAEFNGGGTAGAILVIFSTEGAQQLFLGGEDVFTSAALTAAPGVTQQQLVDAADTVVPDAYEAVKGDTVAEESQDAVGQFLDVISTFLIAFAVIAILVGGFIIANTFSILVAQRIRELALLRALGASRVQVRRSVLLEAGLMALLGASIGIGLGLLLARALATLFREFGLDINADALDLTGTTIGLAYGVGLVVTLVSAFLPARRASRVAPVAAMRDEAAPAEGSLRRRALIGAVVMLAGVGLAAAGILGAPGNDAIWIGAAAVIWILTAAVISPVLGHPLLVACRAIFGKVFGTTGRLAGENALRNPRRTGATASALMIGLALVSAVGTLAASLSATSDELVDDQFAADFLVQSASFQSFPTGIGDDMAEVEGVDILTRDQFTPALVDGDPNAILGVDPAYGQIYTLDVIEGTQELGDDEAVLTDDAARDYGVGLGDSLELAFPGEQSASVEVVGIIEPTPVVGSVNVPLQVLEDMGINRTDTSLSINLVDGADRAEVQAELEDVIADVPIVSVQDKEQFAESIKGQINQLLYMIYGLLALAIVIAVIGIVNTLGLSVIERTREIGLLRAVGLSRPRLRRMVTLESVTISVMGAVLGMAIGLVIGVLLREALKEDLTVLSLPIASLLLFLGIAVLFGVLAAVVPAIRASRMKVLDAIATE